jgi:hypothetical protein
MWVTVMENWFAKFVRMTKILQSQQTEEADSAEMTVVCHQTLRNGAADARYPYVAGKRETSLADKRLRPAMGLCKPMSRLQHRPREHRDGYPFDMVAYSRALREPYVK